MKIHNNFAQRTQKSNFNLFIIFTVFRLRWFWIWRKLELLFQTIILWRDKKKPQTTGKLNTERKTLSFRGKSVNVRNKPLSTACWSNLNWFKSITSDSYIHVNSTFFFLTQSASLCVPENHFFLLLRFSLYFSLSHCRPSRSHVRSLARARSPAISHPPMVMIIVVVVAVVRLSSIVCLLLLLLFDVCISTTLSLSTFLFGTYACMDVRALLFMWAHVCVCVCGWVSSSIYSHSIAFSFFLHIEIARLELRCFGIYSFVCSPYTHAYYNINVQCPMLFYCAVCLRTTAHQHQHTHALSHSQSLLLPFLTDFGHSSLFSIIHWLTRTPFHWHCMYGCMHLSFKWCACAHSIWVSGQVSINIDRFLFLVL